MKSVRIKRREIVFVCGKCLRRHDDGKAIRKTLKTRAKAVDAKMVRASCFGVCPKHAIAIVTRTSMATGRVLILTDASVIEKALRDKIVADG